MITKEPTNHKTNSPLASPIILIVDDVPENLGLLHESLDQSGYTVLVATDGMSAIEIAHQYQPDMILLDGNMPQIDGFECCIQLKSSPITQNIPIIFMTGLTETEHIVKGFKAGGIDYVTKPLNIEEVLVRVDTHLTHAKVLRQQQQIIDVSNIAIVAFNTHGEMIWKTMHAEQLLKNLSTDYSILEEYMQKWFIQIDNNIQQSSLFNSYLDISSERFQLKLLTPKPNEKLHNYLVQIKKSMPHTEDILKHCTELTQREAEVMHWLILGKTNKDIAEILDLSPRTINKHLEHIFEKLAVETRTAAVSMVVNLCQK
ncbi:response regulator transcription factor [Acinetobacter ursingii]|uniref:response regulator transcription factor n=1 Tax=Acinetobacter ursingii TaxID=108980 RepID=UPI0025DA64AB|nr:response regulator transcription factor [uncultured Acinetobacter sp.]